MAHHRITRTRIAHLHEDIEVVGALDERPHPNNHPHDTKAPHRFLPIAYRQRNLLVRTSFERGTLGRKECRSPRRLQEPTIRKVAVRRMFTDDAPQLAIDEARVPPWASFRGSLRRIDPRLGGCV